MNEKIVIENLGLIYKVIKDMHCNINNDDNFEEYYFAGLMGLIEASKTYNEEKGKSGYLYTAIKLKIRNVFISNKRMKRHPEKPTISLNTPIYDKELLDYIEDSYNFEEEFINKEYARWLLSKLKKTMYKQYLMEYFGIDNPQLNIYELAKKYNTTPQYIHQCIKKGIAMLRKEIENEKNNFENKIKMGNKSSKKEYAIKTRN